MTDAAVLRRDHQLAGTPGQYAAVLEPLLLELAGEGATLLSLTLDYGAPAGAAAGAVAEAWIDRSTRTLVFAHARLLGPGGDTLAAASAVLKRDGGGAAA